MPQCKYEKALFDTLPLSEKSRRDFSDKHYTIYNIEKHQILYKDGAGLEKDRALGYNSGVLPLKGGVLRCMTAS